MPAREDAIQLAIKEYREGIFTSIRAAAKAYNIPESTLRQRMKNRSAKAAAHEFQQKLTQLDEDWLVEWIIDKDRRGYPPTHARVRDMAERILRANGDTNPIGRNWVRKFIRRNPRVASILGQKIHAAQVEAATQEQMNEDGWRTAGLYPYNPDRVLSSSQVQSPPRTPTPPRQPLQDTIIYTPKNPQDIYHLQRLIALDGPVSRSERANFRNLSKALREAWKEVALAEEEESRLRLQLDSVRKKIQSDANKTFATQYP